MARWTDFIEESRIAARSLYDYANDFVNPTVRLGVTGLARSGKTVFITALVNALIVNSRLPVFRAGAEGRIAKAWLEPQPDDAVPRFDVEGHLDLLGAGEKRQWPESTRQISELRVVIEYERARGSSARMLTIDIVDYPGEWLLDLALLDQSYAEWSAASVALARQPARAAIAAEWLADVAASDPAGPAGESAAKRAAELFTAYLARGRDERVAASTLPPGRFLMPGDLAGSPALTFAPLDIAADASAKSGSLHAMMARRYESYKTHVVRPFFRDHFARLDRQIVLVDALAAINSGPAAIADLASALNDALKGFRHGRNAFLSQILTRKIDRILIAATKADHLHHANHDRLEAILHRLLDDAIDRAEYAGATVEVVALSAVRATREATVRERGQAMQAIVGVPLAGERAGGETFDGKAEIAMFPGDLPDDPAALIDPERGYRGLASAAPEEADYRFLKFRPPLVTPEKGKLKLPHIRLDRAMEFLIGDRLA